MDLSLACHSKKYHKTPTNSINQLPELRMSIETPNFFIAGQEHPPARVSVLLATVNISKSEKHFRDTLCTVALFAEGRNLGRAQGTGTESGDWKRKALRVERYGKEERVPHERNENGDTNSPLYVRPLCPSRTHIHASRARTTLLLFRFVQRAGTRRRRGTSTSMVTRGSDKDGRCE